MLRRTSNTSIGHWKAVLAVLLLLPLGCSYNTSSPDDSAGVPIVRVRLLQSQDKIMVAASEPPLMITPDNPQGQRMAFPNGAAVPLALAPNGGWQIGNIVYGAGELTVQPTLVGSVSINGQAYRGQYRLVPVATGKFDVVNDVSVEDYLKSVVSKELLWNWHEEAYRAQAIVARTYALYEWRTAGTGRHWDLYPDERSQVYGGLAAESTKSREAVDYTRGVVAAHGPPGQAKIFKAYFSSCCGGITQSAADAFGETYIPPLSDQKVDSLCHASPRFNWGPIVVKKEELTRRFRAWGLRKNRPEKDMALVARIEIQATNRWGRPTRFLVTDARGARYSWTGEELRWAVNHGAQEGTTLNSSFCKIINEPDAVRFVEGHGWGHGAGMCQWCAQRRATSGMRHEDIVVFAYCNEVVLVRAY